MQCLQRRRAKVPLLLTECPYPVQQVYTQPMLDAKYKEFPIFFVDFHVRRGLNYKLCRLIPNQNFYCRPTYPLLIARSHYKKLSL